MHTLLIEQLTESTGGTPSTHASEYEVRSAAYEIAATTVPLLVFHGTSDFFVDLAQACLKRAALSSDPSMRSWFLGATRAPENPATCGGGYETSPTPNAAVAGSMSGAERYFFLYEGEGHAFSSEALDHAGGSIGHPAPDAVVACWRDRPVQPPSPWRTRPRTSC